MTRTERPTVTIVVPARNEARNLERVLPELPDGHEVVLVDGDSVDDTVATARRLLPDIRVVRQTRRGKGNALACGFLAATGDVIVMFDADGSADPAEIPDFLAALTAGADFAKGTRYGAAGGSEDITPLRNLGNAGLNGMSNVLFGTRFSDLCYGYNAFWAHCLPYLELPPVSGDEPMRGDGFEIETLINVRVAQSPLAVAEVASYESRRLHGVSNLNAWRDGWRVLNVILAERRLLRRTQRSTRPRPHVFVPYPSEVPIAEMTKRRVALAEDVA